MGKLGVGSGSYEGEVWRALEKLRQVVLILRVGERLMSKVPEIERPAVAG